MTPVVSVIVPTVRLDGAFSVAVDSLLVQTLAGVEVVVVLDGIADVHRVIPVDDRVVVVRLPERQGTPAALNRGVAASRAPLIARLDADDLADPDRLRRQVDVMRAAPELVLLGSAAHVVDESGERIGRIDVPVDGLPDVLLRRNAFVHSSVMVRRSAFDLVGGYDDRCNRMQDYELWLRLAKVGRLANLDEALVSYRVHDGMHSRTTKPFGPAAHRVRSARMALARHVGSSAARQLLENAVWTVVQLVRHAGLRRPRYLNAG